MSVVRELELALPVEEGRKPREPLRLDLLARFLVAEQDLVGLRLVDGLGLVDHGKGFLELGDLRVVLAVVALTGDVLFFVSRRV